MRRFNPGSTATLRHTVTDANDAPVAATVDLTLTSPAGAPVVPVVTNPSTGVYDAAVADVVIGVYSGAWEISGSVDDSVPVRFYVASDIDELPPLASLDRLGAKLGYVPTGAEADRAYAILDAASELIRSVAGKTWVSETTGALESIPRRVRTVCVEAAFRAFGNPEALSQRSIGDSAKSFDRAGREGGEAVYLTRDEERDIKAAAGTSSLVSVGLYGIADFVERDPWDVVTAE